MQKGLLSTQYGKSVFASKLGDGQNQDAREAFTNAFLEAKEREQEILATQAARAAVRTPSNPRKRRRSPLTEGSREKAQQRRRKEGSLPNAESGDACDEYGVC